MSDGTAWMRQAACRNSDPVLFFQEDAGHVDYRPARAICAGCPVKQECLTFAVVNKEMYGVWGGLTPAERGRGGKKKGRTILFARPCVTCGYEFQPRMPIHVACSKQCAAIQRRAKKHSAPVTATMPGRDQ